MNLPIRDGHCIRSVLALKYCVQRVPLFIYPFNLTERWIDALNAGKENEIDPTVMSSNLQPIVEYIDVAQWLADEEISETRRQQTKLWQQLWNLLECGFTHKEPLNSMDLLAQ
jgi:hypothetical protein